VHLETLSHCAEGLSTLEPFGTPGASHERASYDLVLLIKAGGLGGGGGCEGGSSVHAASRAGGSLIVVAMTAAVIAVTINILCSGAR
jgi:hypothetical protein